MMEQTNSRNTGIHAPIPGFAACDGECFDAEIHATYRPLAETLVKMFSPRRVLELGSGAGSLASWIRHCSPATRVITVDGNPATSQSPFIRKGDHFIARTDQEFILVEKGRVATFDLLLSYEHFEHIPPARFPVFMENLERHAAPGATLAASASAYRYPVHCNIKSAVEWNAVLEAAGLKRLPLKILDRERAPHNYNSKLSAELIYRFSGESEAVK